MRNKIFVIGCFCWCFAWASGSSGHTSTVANTSGSSSSVLWDVTTSIEECTLKQKVSNYGEWVFSRKAGEEESSLLHSWLAPSAAQKGTLEAVPPAWRHDLTSRVMETVSLQPKDPPLYLNYKSTQRVLDALRQGLMIRLRYTQQSNPVVVDLSPVNFRNAFEKYTGCMTQLLPYAFNTVREKRVYFGDGKTGLNEKSEILLQPIIRYINAGAKVLKITLVGYTDFRGHGGYNQKLAEQRAEIVKNYLVAQGIKKELIELKESDPREIRNDKLLKANSRCVIIRLIR